MLIEGLLVETFAILGYLGVEGMDQMGLIGIKLLQGDPLIRDHPPHY